MNTVTRIGFSVPLTIVLGSLAILTGCTTPFPVEQGYVMTLSRPVNDPASTSPASDTLRITWLGTASYHIQLGSSAILTDPFYSHHSPFRIAFGKLETHKERVQSLLSPLEKPSSIFIGHSHYDHLMDTVAAIDTHEWEQTEIYGSRTTKNILHAYENRYLWTVHEADTNPDWQATSDQHLQYMAMLAGHAPQIDGLLVFDGRVSEPLQTVPKRAREFVTGDTFAYLFKLTSGAATFTVYFTGAATPYPEGLPPDTEALVPIDIAILCVPSWEKTPGYPGEFLQALRPRHIILSHFNDFFTAYDEPRTLRWSDLDGFLREVQKAAATYDGFESIIVPDLNVALRFSK